MCLIENRSNEAAQRRLLNTEAAMSNGDVGDDGKGILRDCLPENQLDGFGRKSKALSSMNTDGALSCVPDTKMLPRKDGDSVSSLKSSSSSCSIGSSTADKRPTESPSLASKPSFPFAIQDYDNDDCDEAEKVARAKRIEVILKLSAEAVAKETERKRAANIQPLSWAKPTFEYPSSTSNTQEVAASSSKKRKESQDKSSATARFRPIFPRQPTKEEVDAFVKFTNEWLPSRKRSCTSESDPD